MKRKAVSEEEKKRDKEKEILEKEKEELLKDPVSVIDAFEQIPVVGKKKPDKVVVEDKPVVQDKVLDVDHEDFDPDPLIKWKRMGRGSTILRIDGHDTRIKQNQIFSARESEVPQGFRDLIVPIHPEDIGPVPIKVTSRYNVVADPNEKDRYNVVPPSGKPLNTKPLKKEAALTLLGQIT